MSFAPFLAATISEAWLFYPLALLTVAGALSMLLSRNPIHGAMSLVLTFFGVASIYVLLAAELIAALQIIVYAGAIMVLFVFVIMLLSLNEDDLEVPRIGAGTIVGGGVALTLWVLSYLIFSDLPNQVMPTELPEGFGQVAAVGRLLFGKFILAFEATSILLLGAIVGAVVVAKARI